MERIKSDDMFQELLSSVLTVEGVQGVEVETEGKGSAKFSNESEAAKFWKTHETLNAVSVVPPPHEDSCLRLNLDPAAPAINIGENQALLVPNQWQIVGVDWALQMEGHGLCVSVKDIKTS